MKTLTIRLSGVMGDYMYNDKDMAWRWEGDWLVVEYKAIPRRVMFSKHQICYVIEEEVKERGG
jgi:hypothetical protein